MSLHAGRLGKVTKNGGVRAAAAMACAEAYSGSRGKLLCPPRSTHLQSDSLDTVVRGIIKAVAFRARRPLARGWPRPVRARFGDWVSPAGF